jgi:hypothetical protein
VNECVGPQFLKLQYGGRGFLRDIHLKKLVTGVLPTLRACIPVPGIDEVSESFVCNVILIALLVDSSDFRFQV